MQQKTRDIILTGIAIFTQLFGASNLIFPPSLGAESGSLWFVSYSGFLVTTLVALLAIYTLNKQEGYDKFGQKIGKTFMRIFMAIILIPIFALLVIPRTGAVAYEAGFQQYFSINSLWFYVVYFLSAAFLGIKETKVNKNVAKVLGPMMIVSILIVIIVGLFNLPHILKDPIYSASEIFTKGLSSGYQTADSLGAFIQGGLTLAILRSQGYSIKEQGSILLKGGIIFTVLIGLFYFGLFYLGAISSSQLPEGLSSTQLLQQTVLLIVGANGSMIFSIIIILTCFTTTIGVIGMSASYFTKEYKVNYAFVVMIFAIASIFLAPIGVDNIIVLSGPLFKLISPTLIVLVCCNFTNKLSAVTVKITTYSAIMITALHMLYSDFNIEMFKYLDILPLAKAGLVWLLPSITIVLISHLIFKNKETKKD